jgi:hypothetical protein
MNLGEIPPVQVMLLDEPERVREVAASLNLDLDDVAVIFRYSVHGKLDCISTRMKLWCSQLDVEAESWSDQSEPD